MPLVGSPSGILLNKTVLFSTGAIFVRWLLEFGVIVVRHVIRHQIYDLMLKRLSGLGSSVAFELAGKENPKTSASTRSNKRVCQIEMSQHTRKASASTSMGLGRAVHYMNILDVAGAYVKRLSHKDTD
jgi:hypothetical protein